MNRSAEKDYRVLVKVKNNHILSAIERKGYQNVAQFCEAHGLSQEYEEGIAGNGEDLKVMEAANRSYKELMALPQLFIAV